MQIDDEITKPCGRGGTSAVEPTPDAPATSDDKDKDKK